VCNHKKFFEAFICDLFTKKGKIEMNTEEVLRIERGQDKDIRTNSIEGEHFFMKNKPGVADPDT
jgi:hypothetical protein